MKFSDVYSFVNERVEYFGLLDDRLKSTSESEAGEKKPEVVGQKLIEIEKTETGKVSANERLFHFLV